MFAIILKSYLSKREWILLKANAGDSRAIASVRGHPQLLSFDHKPNHFREKERILDGGGFVENNRVNGNLALSRAFGDFSFKKNVDKGAQDQIVTGKFVLSFTKYSYFLVESFLIWWKHT